MDNRPIGVFDSGLGGLTSIPYLMESLPNERLIYFGDTARTPYGSKAESTVRRFAGEIASFLVDQNVKMIVIACNTVSAICTEELSKRFPDIPVVGIIDPATEKIVATCSGADSVGIIGTKVTINSGIYSDKILRQNGRLDVHEIACPLFVPLIEEGFGKSDIMNLTIEYYLNDFVLENRLDTMVLGCTHYPLIEDNIRRLYPNVSIINPSKEIAKSVKKILEEKDMLATNPSGENVFYASDLSWNFRNMIKDICTGSNNRIQFKNFDLDVI